MRLGERKQMIAARLREARQRVGLSQGQVARRCELIDRKIQGLLSRLRPPGGNSRPEGVVKSYFAMASRGELPTAY
jgi:hypothetical protein